MFSTGYCIDIPSAQKTIIICLEIKKKQKRVRKKNLTLTSSFLVTTNVDKVKQSRTFQIIRQECWTLHLMLRLMCYANKHFCGKGELQMGFSNMYSS